MANDIWFEIGTRIVARRPEDIDADVFAAGKTKKGDWLPQGLRDDWRAPASSAWVMSEPDRVSIGIRVTEPLDNVVDIAAQLVAMASERGVTPVILSTIPESGFEHFGFRVERVGGANPREIAACEEEIKRFWDIVVVIDAAQSGQLR